MSGGNSTTSQPSWQSLQRQGSIPFGNSGYQGSGSMTSQQQQSWRPAASQDHRNSSSDSPAPLPFPGSQSHPEQQQQHRMTKSSTFSQMETDSNGATSPPLQQNPQQQVHRRTQSLRPLSAFQPLEHPDGAYSGGNAGGAAGHRPSSPTGSTTRSIRTAAAPLTFKSPELRSALGLQEAQHKKIYMEGYLSRRDHLTADGRPLNMNDPKKRWHLCFVQLSGTVLSVWSVQQMEEAARQGTEVPPSYINVTDCFVDFIGTITESPQEVPGTRGRYENVFAINTAGQNRILFGVEGQVGRRLVQAWVNGIRLASWEKVRLEEIYTGSLVRARLGAVSAQQATSGPGGAPGDVEMSIKSPLSKNGRMEGWVKARFMGSTEWKKCWLVLTDKGAEGAAVTTEANADRASVTSVRDSFWKKLRSGDRTSFIGASSTPALADTGLSRVEVPPGSNGAPGLACFYESKKVKKPFATLAYASHAFAVYPSRPELVEGSSLFKVEGAFPLSATVSATNRTRQTGWVMIMPELDGPGSKGANAEMMKWCIAFMDAFHLYGRPTQFQWDARNPVSPFFAYPIGPYKDRLFLDRELAEFLDIREERHLANRNNLHGIMAARMRGERTPILPPLPQPNTESTRNLNGPQTNGNGSSSSNGNAAKSLPPLSFGRKEDSSASSSSANSVKMPPNASGDAPPASRGGLDSIGERSREGSIMTTLNTPITPVTGSMHNNLPSGAGAVPKSDSGKPQTEAVPVGAGGGTEFAQDQSSSAVRSLDESNGLPYLAPASAVAGAGVGVATAAALGHTHLSASKQDTNSAGQANTTSSQPDSKSTSSANQLASQASSGRGVGAESSAPVISRKESDTGSYDEGALYYMSSMADQLPNSSQPTLTSSAPTRVAPQAGPAEKVAANASNESQQRTAVPSSSATTSAQAVRPTSMRAEGLDQDAMAAYSFLNQEPSPEDGKDSLPPVPAAKDETPLSANQVPTYPSTFANKKAQERKMAAQAQAQAHQDALTKPGRAAGAKKGLKPSGTPHHAWADDESEDDDDDDDDEADDEQVRRPSVAPPVRPPARNYSGSPGVQPVGTAPPSLYGGGAVLRAQQQQQRSTSPQAAQSFQQAGPARFSMFNQHLAAGHEETRSNASYSPSSTAQEATQQRNTFVQLGQDEQPGAMTAAFQPHGLLQAGAQDKAERSAKQQEAQARAEGTHMVNVDSKRPPPQAGLLGAISAHERDRKKDGGLGATLTERERERVQAERRQREEDMMRMQQQQQMGGPPPPGWGMPMNPMMWQQMQMMMMNPQMMMPPNMYGSPQASGSQYGHGRDGSSGHGASPSISGGMSPEQIAAQQQAQMYAAQAAQQAYMQAMSQHGGGSMMGGEGSGMPSPPMGMMPFNPYMSMYGGFPGFMPGQHGPGSEASGMQRGPPSPSAAAQTRGQERLSNSPLRR